MLVFMELFQFCALVMKEVLALAISEDNICVSNPLPLHETLHSFLETLNSRQYVLLQRLHIPKLPVLLCLT